MNSLENKSELKEILESLVSENDKPSIAEKDKPSTMIDFRKGSNMEAIFSDLKTFSSIQTQYLKTIASSGLKAKPDVKPTPTTTAKAPTVEEDDSNSGSGFGAFSTALASGLAANLMGPLAKFIVPLISMIPTDTKRTDNVVKKGEENGVSNPEASEPSSKSSPTSDGSIAVEPNASIKIDFEQGSNLEAAITVLKEYGKQTNDYLKSMVDFNTRMESAARQNSVGGAAESKRMGMEVAPTVMSDGKQVETPAGGGFGAGDLLGTVVGGLGVGKMVKSLWKGAKNLLGFGGKTGAEAGEKAAAAAAKSATGAAAEKGAESVAKSAGRELATEGVETAGKKVGAKAISKVVAEVVGAKAAKMVAKAVPGIGLIAGLGFGIWRLASGDWKGAAVEVAGGAASTFPGVGTGVAVATDIALLARDVYEAVYGIFPEDDPLSGERLGEITSAVSSYVESMVMGDSDKTDSKGSTPNPSNSVAPPAPTTGKPSKTPPPSVGGKKPATPPPQGFRAQHLNGQTMKPVPPVTPVTPNLATSELDDDTTGLDLIEDFAKRMGLTEEIKSGKMQGGVPVEINGIPVPKDLYTPAQLKMLNAAQKISDAMGGDKTAIPITKDNSFDAQFQTQLQAKKDAMGDGTLTPNTDAFVPFDKPNPNVTYKSKEGGFVNDENASPADRARMRGNKYVAPTFTAPTVAEKPTGQPPAPVVIVPPSDSKGSAAPVVHNNSTTHVNVTKDPSNDLMFNQMLGGF